MLFHSMLSILCCSLFECLSVFVYTDLACSDSSGLLMSCGDDFGACIPRTYYCDGIRNCRGGEDEAKCEC